MTCLEIIYLSVLIIFVVEFTGALTLSQIKKTESNDKEWQSVFDWIDALSQNKKMSVYKRAVNLFMVYLATGTIVLFIAPYELIKRQINK